MTDKKIQVVMQIKSLNNYNNDPTLKLATFSIMDDGISYNRGLSGKRQKLSSESLQQIMDSTKEKPIFTKYFEVSEPNEDDDHLGTHEQFINVNKKGEEFMDTGTVSIGHFISEGRTEVIDGVNVAIADAVLYYDKYKDAIDLLEDWLNRGIKVNTSSEYLYQNYEVIDDLEIINIPVILSGHTILNSEARGDSNIILGAYENSMLMSLNNKQEWNSVMNTLQENNAEENLNKRSEDMLKKVCELSHQDIRWKLYDALEKVMPAIEFWDAFVYDVYDEKFVYSIWNQETKGCDYFEVMYTKTEDSVEINLEGKTKVDTDWVAVQNELITLKEDFEKISNELETSKTALVESETTLKTLNSDKVTLEDSVKTLNSKLVSLEAIEKIHNAEQLEKSINARKEEFEPKFKKMNALESFESEEVQELLVQSASDDKFLAQLNSILVDLIPNEVEPAIVPEGESVKQMNSRNKDNLMDLKSKDPLDEFFK